MESCPCGSGLSAVRCCAEPLIDPALQYTDEDRSRALRKMETLLMRPTSRRLLETASELFWGEALPEGEEGANEFLSNPNLLDNLNGFLYFDIGAFGESSAAELMLEEPAKRLSRAERAFLEAALDSTWRLYEVLESRPGEGLVVQDLWQPRKYWVRERLASKQLVRFDVIGARLMHAPDGHLEFEGGVLHYLRAWKTDLLTYLHEAYELHLSEEPDLTERDFFKCMVPVLAQWWITSVADTPPIPRMQTPEGDEVVFCTARFEVRDRERLVQALDHATDLRGDEEEGWTWIEPSGSSDRSLGQFSLIAGVLDIQVTSRERLVRAQTMLAQLAEGCLRHLDTQEKTVAELLATQGPEPEQDPAHVLPLADQQEIVSRMFDAHYTKWLDESIPALDGWTPRRAVQDERMRQRVVELLKGLDNDQERKRQAGEIAYDSTWMWAALGLLRPGPQ